MATMTITEGLAELKTITARLKKKRESLMPYLWRQEGLKDPLEKEVVGGSVEFIKRERQAISDLEVRYVAIRTAIQTKNLATTLTVEGITKDIQSWLNWRKEVAIPHGQFIAAMIANIENVRKNAQAKGFTVFSATVEADKKQMDILVNVEEAALRAEIEQHEKILGTLDGQLSLKVATTTIDV